jgi:hypothetical protein
LVFRVIGFDSVFICTNVQNNWSCQQETQDAVARRSNPSRFRAQEEFRVRLEPPVHILDNNAVSVGTTPQPAGLEASKGVISVNYSNGPPDPSWQDNPGTKTYFDFMTKYYADCDKACDRASLVTSKLTHNRQVQACKKRRIRRLTSEMWFRVGRLFHGPTIFALNAGSHRGCRGWSGVDAVLARILL